mmetsp:Transcript_9755/g.14674  ORF Transcript_9755/g.14674 Transcript_9755/m.14674 type:complete len:247 (-) Transcript_9755:514-1254(-)
MTPLLGHCVGAWGLVGGFGLLTTGASNLQGGFAVLHEVTIDPVQHCPGPPGLLSHPNPPQSPHVAGQQNSPDALTTLLLGQPATGLGSFTIGPPNLHGGLFVLQEFVIWPVQHKPAPPGLLSQPNPPHAPHAAGQQNSPDALTTPLFGQLVIGTGSSTPGPSNLHGGLLVLQELTIEPVQHWPAPPGLLSHPNPPHAPHVAGQQNSPEAFKTPLAPQPPPPAGGLLGAACPVMMQGRAPPSHEALN